MSGSLNIRVIEKVYKRVYVWELEGSQKGKGECV